MDKISKLQEARVNLRNLYTSEVFTKEHLYRIVDAENLVESVLKEIREEKNAKKIKS